MTKLKDVAKMTPEQITRAEWRMVGQVLRTAQKKMRGGQTWMDAAINLCRERGRGRMQELENADIYLNTDYTCDCPPEMIDDEHFEKCKPYEIYSLRTLHDPSVGISGWTVSPDFKSVVELETWLDNLSPDQYNKMLEDDEPPDFQVLTTAEELAQK
jgi:hypothetical protein